ncbi:MAG: DUF3943 domain-containing protein [Deltaproteobacteria bacterium]|nr:MAG: DUF3943 domain-containing protein [Deltaproteobacteria bacterium]
MEVKLKKFLIGFILAIVISPGPAFANSLTKSFNPDLSSILFNGNSQKESFKQLKVSGLQLDPSLYYFGETGIQENDESEFRNASLTKVSLYISGFCVLDMIALVAFSPQQDELREKIKGGNYSFQESWEQFKWAYTHPPVWDESKWYTNYILHPIAGAETYLLARNRGYSVWGSFLFSTAVSVGWEYIFEAWIERPSRQDLIITSPVGSLLGELRYHYKKKLMIDGHRPLWKRICIVVLDPIDAMFRAFE